MTGKVKLVLLIAVLIVAAGVLGRAYWSAGSPSSVKVTVYRVELMTGASDANPQVVFSNAVGLEIDLADPVGAVIGQAQIKAGAYNRVRMTVANGVKMSIANADDNPCGDDAFADRVIPVFAGTDPNAQVPLYFATHEDGGGTWSGPQMTHYLLGPVTVSENRIFSRKFSFATANTLFCSGGSVQSRTPWVAWAEAPL